MNGLSRKEERNLIRRAMAENGLRLTVCEKSLFREGAIVSETLYTGRSDDEEVVASGTCLAEVLESIEKWRKDGAAARAACMDAKLSGEGR